ncbi:MAG: Histidinol-phosphate aminotransferase 1 [Planctomycetota bacterium]|jgi:histidinol-phosphate/aromatic aminotransferase/cobyric acid decarboxylase-like protein/GNAT superfamily N-acetyltransferase
MDLRPCVQSESSTVELEIGLADEQDRKEIYRQRHQVYSAELGQHAANCDESISDPIDEINIYLVVKRLGSIVGFISITPKGSPRFSIDKYLDRIQFKELDWDSLYEIRLFTVIPDERNTSVASLLLYGAARWLQENKASSCIAMGRKEVMRLYRKIGFFPLGKTIKSGDVEFELMMIDNLQIDEALKRFEKVRARIGWSVHWNFSFPRIREINCYHGGASIESLCCNPDKLESQKTIINADVLDAWFPVSPSALSAMADHISWLAKTSPPVLSYDLEKTIGKQRGIDPNSVLAGAGSSDLIFRAFQNWLDYSSRVLLVTPCYGEYEYVCRQVIGCQVDYLETSVENGFSLDQEELVSRLAENSYDLVVIVNPNNPTGVFWSRMDWERVVDRIPGKTRVWIDECYIDFVDSRQSLERVASKRNQLIVCKSLSKCLALSGLRVGYLTCSSGMCDELRRVTPPWNIGMLGQIAATAALQDRSYYDERYRETHALRQQLESDLHQLGFVVVPGTANFTLVYLPPGIAKLDFLSRCRARQLFIRDMFPTSPCLGERAVRIAVKSEPECRRMIDIIRQTLLECGT